MTAEATGANPVATGAISTWSLSIPVAMGYVPLGAVFGFLLVQAGAAWWCPPLASLAVFAGAAQFMAIPMLASGAPVGAIVLATAVVNLRHVFYGLSLLDRMPSNPLSRAYLVWTLTDENYSVLTTLPRAAAPSQVVGVVMLNHFWWVFGSLLGAVAGAQVTNAITGLDFSLTALFAVLAVGQWRATKRAAPLLCATIAYGVALKFAPAQALAVSIGLSLVVAIALSRGASSRGDA